MSRGAFKLQRARITVETRKGLSTRALYNTIGNIKRALLPIYLPIEGEPCFVEQPWYTSRTTNGNVQMRRARNGVEISIREQTHEPFYVTHNSLPSSFKKLRFAEGVRASGIDSLCIGSFGQNERTLSCSLVVLEFDRRNERIGSSVFPLNTVATYRPSSDAWRLIFCIQLRGVGRCTIYGLRLSKERSESVSADSTEEVTALSTTDGNTDHARRTELVESAHTVDEAVMFVRYDEFRRRLTEAENTVNSFSAKAYKWKRRALDWERKYRSSSTGRDTGGLAYEALLALAGSLPSSNGCQHFDPFSLTVGVITDVYMFNFYKDAFSDVHYLSPDTYEQSFANTSFDIVLYVTCWKGIHDEEWRGIKFRQKPASALDSIIGHARRTGAKLVFQSIEDPSNFEYFLPIAKKFDYVFTSDVNTIERYKAECGHDRVFYGEYGVNPRLNNPIGCRRHMINAAFFAGSYPKRYKERCDDMEMVFDSILASGGRLVIADRNYGDTSEELKYPERFRGSTIPSVDHALLQSMHKLFRYNLNFNSIKGSPTMCAMRVYELQALGTGVLSNYARSVFNRFPDVRIIPWQENLELDFADGGLEEYRANMALTRNVLNDRTSYDTVRRMLSVMGEPAPETITRTVCVICVSCDAVSASFERQTYSARVLVESSTIDTQEQWDTFREANRISYFTWFSETDEYEENYLQDLVNGFKYTDSHYVVRNAWFDGHSFHDAAQHEYTTFMGGRARSLFAADKFSPIELGKLSPHGGITLPHGYAIDPFELNYRRYKERGRLQGECDPALSVIVPVFNNGRFLKAKCLASLRRNALWPRIEVILVDDGSTDPDTKREIEILGREYPNIRTFSYEDGGSGSASRPRNKGIEMATAPLISFLDPDNEIAPGGYDTLCALYEDAGSREGGVDFVAGYHAKVQEQTTPIGRHSSERLKIIDDARAHFFARGKFPVIPTQPAVIARRLFQNPNLRFVEGAAGQDTLFGWELLAQAKRAAFTDAAYLIYYAQRENSITNAVDSTYFEKKLVLEKAQVDMLARNGLMDRYLDHHYEDFMRNWYLPKLAQVPEGEERARCIAILNNIAALYQVEPPLSLEAERATVVLGEC